MRVRLRLPLDYHDIACTSPTAVELREEILRLLPKNGEPLELEQLILR